MRLSRILLPIIWPMVAVFAIGAAIGVAVPQAPPESSPVVSDSPVPEEASATDAPPPKEGGKGRAETGEPNTALEQPSPAPTESPAPSPTPAASPSASSTCTDAKKVVVVNVLVSDANPLDVGDVFSATGSPQSIEASEVTRLETLIEGKSDVVFLASGNIARELVDALRGATKSLRAWVIVAEATRDVWSEVFGKRVFGGDVSSPGDLKGWVEAKLPCLGQSV